MASGAIAALKDATGNGQQVVEGRSTKRRDFPALLEGYRAEIARALPRHMNPDTMLRIALTAFRMTPKLAECAPLSVIVAVVQASQMGLRPNMLGECYLIPYKDQCQLIVGYQGLLQLARRSGEVEQIGAYLVHEKDTFAVTFGTDPGITHVPFLDGAPGKVRFGYAVAKLRGGATHVETMRLDEIETIRDRSSNVQNAKRLGKKTPWDTDFEEMARKTLVRRICKYLPKSPELATALAIDATSGPQNLNIADAAAGLFIPPPVEAIEDNPSESPSKPAPAVDALSDIERHTGQAADDSLPF